MRMAAMLTLLLLGAALVPAAEGRSAPDGDARFTLQASLQPEIAEVRNARYSLRGQLHRDVTLPAHDGPEYFMQARLAPLGVGTCSPDVIFANGFELP